MIRFFLIGFFVVLAIYFLWGLAAAIFKAFLKVIDSMAETKNFSAFTQNMRDKIFSSGGMNPEEALGVLGLRETCTKKDIENAYKLLMLKVHPDRGGSADEAAKVNQARDVLLKWVKE